MDEPRVSSAPTMRLWRDPPLDPERLAFLAPCIDAYGVGDPSVAEWPNNMISTRAVAYASGRIARRDALVRHAIDREELALCHRLATEAATLVGRMEVGMGSSSGDVFHPYWAVANADETPAARIDEALVAAAFGGTLFPLATILVEPLDEGGVWWSAVEEDGAESPQSYFEPWRNMIRWFAACPELVDRRFVSIGDRQALWDAERDPRLPSGTELTPCTLPRLALGLTRAGSLVGLFGWTVQT